MQPFPRVLPALALVAVAVAVIGTGITGSPQSVQAATATPSAKTTPVGTTYYVNNAKGVKCSDTGPGTSRTAPWCTFTPAATLTLGAGDSLLLAKGASWSQQLKVGLQGTAANPATLGSYGSGAAPRILYNDSGVGVALNDADNAVVTGLDVGAKTATGTSALSYGFLVTYDSIGHSNLTMQDIAVHDNQVVGLFVRSTVNTTRAQTVLTDLTLRRITTTHNAHGIVVTDQGGVTDLPEQATPGNVGSNVFTNVLVDGIRQSHDDNNNPAPIDVPSQIVAGCPDSLAIGSSNHVTVRDSILDGSAACRTAAGTAAIFLGVVDHVLIANNMLVNTPNTMNPDMVAIDHEAQTNDVTIAGNYFADNYGGAVEYLAIHGPNDFSQGGVTAGNVFVNNGVVNSIPYPGDGAIAQIGDSVPVQATIADNLSFEPNGLLNAHLGGSTAGFTTSNNVLAASADDISHSAAGYRAKATRWGYQYAVGNKWKALSYDSASAAYRAAGVSVDQFDVTPSASSAASLTWTAPSSGAISLRAFPVAVAGTATVTVTVNGTKVAAGTVGTSGALLKADDVTVRNGDVVRFAVSAGSGKVSLTPSVAYTSQSISTDKVGQWSFSVAGNAQGWTSNVPTVIRRGVADLTTKGGTTTFDSASKLKLSAAASSSLRLTYYNGTSASSGTVSFTTDRGAVGSVPFSINPKSDSGSILGFQSVVVALAGNAAWKGTIQKLRVAVTGATGDFQIDSIELAKPAVSGWEFDSAAGWTQNPNVACSTPGTPSANPTVDVDNSQGTFYPYADINWANTRMQTFTVGTPRLAQIDFWASKTGDPQGCLYFRVVKITKPATHKGTTLFTGAVSPSQVSAAGGFVSVYPGLTGLDTHATYGLEIFSPYVIPGGGTYGVQYSDDSSHTASSFGEFYSIDNNGTWNGPETNRSLNFRTYTAATIAKRDTTVGYSPVTVAGGVLTGSGGYEPALLSPGKLGVKASGTRYVHIRMSNPDNLPVGYLLFTTKADPTFDEPGDGGSPPDEAGGKGVTIPLVSGAGFHDYTIDMSAVAGWKGTIEQLMIEPAHRWSYRISGDLSSTWSGQIDYVRLDTGTVQAAKR